MSRTLSDPFTSTSHWSEVFQLQQASGLSIRKFCRHQPFTEGSFYYWKRKLFQDPELVESSGSSFVELAFPFDDSITGPQAKDIQITFGQSTSIVFSPGIDPVYMRSIFRLVRQELC